MYVSNHIRNMKTYRTYVGNHLCKYVRTYLNIQDAVSAQHVNVRDVRYVSIYVSGYINI